MLPFYLMILGLIPPRIAEVCGLVPSGTVEFFENVQPSMRRALLRLVGGDRRHRGQGFPAPSFLLHMPGV